MAIEQGRVVGFSGRVLAGDEKTAKYVNAPETPIFRQEQGLFWPGPSKRALVEAAFAVVCEGRARPGSWPASLAGVENVVAPQGTALPAEATPASSSGMSTPSGTDFRVEAGGSGGRWRAG